MIPADELARLAAFYDRFANHLDPLAVQNEAVSSVNQPGQPLPAQWKLCAA
jgi:hypothetical protein